MLRTARLGAFGPVASASGAVKDTPDVRPERRQISLDHHPYRVEIDAEVAVNESIAGPGGKAPDCRDGLQDMREIEIVARAHSGRASARIRSFRRGCSSASVHKSILIPSASSISICKPAMSSSDEPGRRFTRRSRSLSSRSARRAAEPKMRRFLAPPRWRGSGRDAGLGVQRDAWRAFSQESRAKRIAGRAIPGGRVMSGRARLSQLLRRVGRRMSGEGL